jgi:hypothetical protein
MLPDVMAVRPSAQLTSSETETVPTVSANPPDEGGCSRASSDIDTAGRERPPQTVGRGRAGHATPGSFTPRFPRFSSATRARLPADGTRRRPLSATSTRTTRCRSVSLAHYAGETCAHTGVAKAHGGSSAGGQVRFRHLSPVWRHSHSNQGRRLRLHRPLGTASTAEHVAGVADAIERR